MRRSVQDRNCRRSPRPQPLPNMTPAEFIDVLVAEDNEVNQIVFTQILQETGRSFLVVGNG